MDDSRIFNLEDVLPTFIVPSDGGKPYELLKFNFNENKTNEITAHGKAYRIEILNFHGNYRVDLYENGKMSAIGENTGNHTFGQLVDTSLPIEKQVIHWASQMINKNDTCDCCGSFEIIIPLSSYDIEEFPHFKDKKVCQNCRTKAYTESIGRQEEEEQEKLQQDRNEMKKQGAKYHYTFWIHPNRGDDFAIDMYTSRKMTQAEMSNEQRKLKLEYGARMVEDPSIFEL